jgi:pimeloyl-ACP methyl ester carboxylesterase
MARLSVRPLFLAFMNFAVVLSSATSAPLANEVQVNGVRLPYVEQGTGEPVVLVHGAFSDLRIWEPLRHHFAERYRVIAYNQRYFGTTAWPDDGRNFSPSTHADDLAKLIRALNLGPVHLVTRSYGGLVATKMALENRSLVRSLTLHEPALLSVLPADSEAGKAARVDRAKHANEAMAANKSGDTIKTVRLFFEGVYQLGPGGFDQMPQATRTMVLDNARTSPLIFGSLAQQLITCDALKTFGPPTLLTSGSSTHAYYRLIVEGVARCVPGAKQVAFPNLVHDAPSRDPAAFATAVLEFLASRPGH